MVLRRIGSTSGNTGSGRTIHLSLEQLEDRSVPSATDLGIAGEFNAFIFDDFTGYWSDVEGRLAVGQDADLKGYGIGDKLPNSNGTRDDLIVGDDLTYQWGQVFNGNIVYGDTANLIGVGVPNGTVRQDNVIDFAAVEADLQTKSGVWATFGTNGTIENNWGNLVLKGTNADLNVFNISAAQLQGIWSLTIDAPAGSTVLVNVTGANVSLQYFGMQVQGTDGSRVLFNLHEATQVNIQGVGIQGNVLAPLAHVQFDNGSFLGTLVANSFTGQGQLNRSTIRIHIPEYVPGGLSGTVFNDINSNGRQESGEAGVVDVTLILTGGISVYMTDATDSDGNFNFINLPPGTYTVAIIVPDPYVLASLQVGSVSGVASLATGEITSIPLSMGAFGIDYDFGINIPDDDGGVD